MAGTHVYRSPFTPDVVEEWTDATPSLESDDEAKELPPDIRGVRLQIKAIQVMDGLQGRLGLGKASGVYVISSVVDGLGDSPVTFSGKPYRDVNNGDLLPLAAANDPTAVFNVYLREAPIPRILSFALLVLRSNADLREIGTAISKLQSDDRYKTLANLVTTTVALANPAYSVVWQAANDATGLLAEYLGSKPDDQLGYYQANYTNLFDNLGVGLHPPDGTTMRVDKIRLAYHIDAM